MLFNKEFPFDLPLLPPAGEFNSSKYADLLISARVALAEMKGFSFSMPNPLLLLSPAILRESIASSEIENIHTTIIDVLQNQLFPEKERRETDKEVLRYRDAILCGYKMLDKFPISTRLILGIQQNLVPVSHGEYRKNQNAIVNHATMERLYTPPIAPNIPGLMGNWEKFINDDKDGIDPLIKSAIAHYQFEAIHPFDDGNGRTGRILMVLYLVQQGLLTWPILYISGFINKNRNEYYKLLSGITEDGKWEEFILFMLKGFYSQAMETKTTMYDIMELFNKYREKIKTEHKKIYTADLVETLFSYPIITPVKLGKETGTHYTTASRHLIELTEAGILKETKAGKYRFFANKELLKILQR